MAKYSKEVVKKIVEKRTSKLLKDIDDMKIQLTTLKEKEEEARLESELAAANKDDDDDSSIEKTTSDLYNELFKDDEQE